MNLKLLWYAAYAQDNISEEAYVIIINKKLSSQTTSIQII